MQVSSASFATPTPWAMAQHKPSSGTPTAASAGNHFSTAVAQAGSSPPDGQPPGPPPGQPPGGSESDSHAHAGSSATSGLSTLQFASRGATGSAQGMPSAAGSGGRQDPIASLDSDGNSSVSAEEFGLDGASDAAQALFSAIDSDSSGELSGSEVDGFRQQMVAAMDSQRQSAGSGATAERRGTEGGGEASLQVDAAQGGAQAARGPHGGHGPHGAGGPPPGPPPSGAATGSADDAASDSDSDSTNSVSAQENSSTTSAQASEQLKAMLELIAKRYSALSSSEATASFFTAEA